MYSFANYFWTIYFWKKRKEKCKQKEKIRKVCMYPKKAFVGPCAWTVVSPSKSCSLGIFLFFIYFLRFYKNTYHLNILKSLNYKIVDLDENSNFHTKFISIWIYINNYDFLKRCIGPHRRLKRQMPVGSATVSDDGGWVECYIVWRRVSRGIVMQNNKMSYIFL
jgi:hypothetical protein